MASVLAWLRRILLPVQRCAWHTWQRNEYGVLVCAMCHLEAETGDIGIYW